MAFRFLEMRHLQAVDDEVGDSSSTSSPDIPPANMAVAVIPVVLVLILGVSLKLGNVWTLVVAASRCVMQLLLLGLILTPVLEYNRVSVVFPYLLVMIAFATREASVKPKFQYVGMRWHMLLAITASLTGSLALISFGVLQPDPWWDAQTIIPVGGMMLGSSVNALSLGMDRFWLSLSGGSVETTPPQKRRRGNSKLDHKGGGGGGTSTGSAMLQTYLACGATRWEAALPSLRQAIETGLTPNLNQMSVMGLVSIPGMLTGQILAGTSPWIAAKYQIVIMFFVACNSTWILFLCMIQAIYTRLFSNGHCFCGDLVWKRTGGKPKDLVLAFISLLCNGLRWMQHHFFCCESSRNSSDGNIGNTELDPNDDKTKVLSSVTNGFVQSPSTLESQPACLIRLKRGNLRYDDRLLLKNVNLDVFEKQILLLSGASGTGKSSFLRALALLQPMEYGDLTFKGAQVGSSTNTDHISPTEWRSQVLYVRQAGGQGLEGTPRDNLRKVRNLSSQKARLPSDFEELESRFIQSLAKMSLGPDMMDKSWGNMSGGEAQRVYLCMLLSLQPAVLLLDEPTSACDEQNAKNVEQTIIESGIAVIWISHDPAQIMRLEEMERTSLIRIAPTREEVHDEDQNHNDNSTTFPIGTGDLVAQA